MLRLVQQGVVTATKPMGSGFHPLRYDSLPVSVTKRGDSMLLNALKGMGLTCAVESSSTEFFRHYRIQLTEQGEAVCASIID